MSLIDRDQIPRFTRNLLVLFILCSGNFDYSLAAEIGLDSRHFGMHELETPVQIEVRADGIK